MPIRLTMTCAASVICILAIGADGPPAAPPAAGAGVTIYDPDPQHLWNRLHRALAVRTVDGVDYGTDVAVPFITDGDDLLTGDAHAELLSVLDELLATRDPDRLPAGLPRALLQHEAWAAFDLTLHETMSNLPAPRKALRARLAKAIATLAMTEADIARLPDNYADAAKSNALPRDFDPAHPDEPFLPPGLFDTTGPWVEIGDDWGRPVAPTHVGALQGRSIFRIFIRCPGERKDTLAYLETLNLHPTPWALEPATIATTYPDGGKVRWDPLRASSDTPQFPQETMVALVRQMIVIDDQFRLVATPITQGVEMRVFRKVGPGVVLAEADQADAQAFFELKMRRGPLLAGKAGGLHAVAKDELEYQLFPIGRAENASRASHLRGTAGMAACTTCHSGNGIFSVNTYRRGTNPQLFPTRNTAYLIDQSLGRKRERFDWGVLRGMLEAER